MNEFIIIIFFVIIISLGFLAFKLLVCKRVFKKKEKKPFIYNFKKLDKPWTSGRNDVTATK